MAFGATFNLASLNGSNGFRLDNTTAGSLAGADNALVDVNGDGFDDLVIGFFNATVPPNGGAVYVVFGMAGGFAASASLVSVNGFNFVAASVDDDLGYRIGERGDFNGDGFEDLSFAAPYADPMGRSNAGAAYVVFGKASGLTGSTNVQALDGQNGFRLDSPTALNGFSITLAAIGDINADGFDDLAIGVPDEDPGGRTNAGELFVYYGKAGGFSASVDLGAGLAPAAGFRLDGLAAGDRLGSAVTPAGDVNGDGIDDFIVSAYHADPLGRTDAGSAYVVFGRRGGFGSGLDFASLNGTGGFRIDGAPGDELGLPMGGAVDLNGDGFDDLLLGCYLADPGGRTDAGRAYVVFGKASGFAASLDLTTLNGTNGFSIDGLGVLDWTGRDLANAGDLNGDGIDEMVVSATAATAGGLTRAGAAYVIWGSTAARPAAVDLANLGSSGMTINGAAVQDLLGYGPAGGDINGDGLSDLLVGAVYTNGGAGSVYAIYGQASGPSTVGADTLTGTAAVDRFNGLAGNDIVRGMGGDDLMRGGPGLDASAYAGTASQYDWWRRPDGTWIVKDLRAGGPEGSDTLTDIESLQFSDKTVKILGLTTAEKLTDAYSNILRATATGAELTFLNGLITSVGNASKTLSAAIGEIVGKADQTTAVAAMSYQFFLNFVPSKGGFDYLVSPQGPNPNNINSAYYQSFNIENRYINFAVNLGKAGEGAPSFLAEYGAKTLFQATQSAYIEIFGGTVVDSKINTILDTTFQIAGQTVSRAQYFALYGGDGLTGIGTKAAMVGWLLTEAAKADLGMYANSSNAFLTDLADGAQTLVDVVGTYGRADYVFNG